MCFQIEKIKKLKFKGNARPQDLVLTMPNEVMPYALRFDIGGNVEQDPIEIKKFEVDYLDKSIVVKDTIFRYFFYPNDQIDYDIKTAIAKPKKVEGKLYDPIFMPSNDFKKDLEKLYK